MNFPNIFSFPEIYIVTNYMFFRKYPLKTNLMNYSFYFIELTDKIINDFPVVSQPKPKRIKAIDLLEKF